MQILYFLLVCCLFVFPYKANAGNIIKCKDKSGNTVFAQDVSDCATDIEERSDIVLPVTKVGKGKVNYRYPQRAYISEKGKWDIYVEQSMKEADSDLYNSSLAKLLETLEYVFAAMPEHARNNLSKLKVFLLWGEASPLGGRKKGMSYIRKGEPANYSYLDKRWEHALIVYSAKNLAYLSELWARKAVFHEMAHAWHIVNWPDRHPPIFEAWQNAKTGKKYLDVHDIKGKMIKSAYARKNQLEYFAELSAMYFVGGNYYPYDKSRLEEYDPVGYSMIEKLWF